LQEGTRLASPRRDLAATPALDLLDTIALTEAEAHFQDAIIVESHKTQEPADGRRQAPGRIVALVVHLAASARTLRVESGAQEHLDPFTVSQSSPAPQTGTAAWAPGR